MGASVIDFQMHKIFSENLLFAECISSKYKKWRFSALPQHCGKRQKQWKLFWGKAENYFIINLLKFLRLFLPAVVGGPSFAWKQMFPGIYARAQESEWIWILFNQNHWASAMLTIMVCTKYILKHRFHQRVRRLNFIREYRHLFELTKPLNK